MLRSKARALAGALVVSVALAACGGSSSTSSGVSPATYVKAVCQAVGPFEKDVQTRSAALNLTTVKSAAEGKKALQDFLNAVVTDANAAVAKLKAAGNPSVKNGAKIQTAVVTAFTELQTALQKAAGSAGSLPTNSATAFRDAAQKLGTNVQASMSGIGSGLSSSLKSAELEAAAKKEPACTSLSG